MIGKAVIAAAGTAISLALAAPAAAGPVPSPRTVPNFLGAARSAGVTGSDPAMLEDGYSVCRRVWIRHLPGEQIAAGLVQDHPSLTLQQAGQFVLAAYNNLCPVPGGTYDYWAYSTS
jgi:hypothetical protein